MPKKIPDLPFKGLYMGTSPSYNREVFLESLPTKGEELIKFYYNPSTHNFSSLVYQWTWASNIRIFEENSKYKPNV